MLKIYKVLKLHLELVTDLDDYEQDILRKYGKVENGVTRDILVPGDMTLHGLTPMSVGHLGHWCLVLYSCSHSLPFQ